MSLSYPDRDAVLTGIAGVSSNLVVLRNFVESYMDLRKRFGPKDGMAVEFSTTYLIPKEGELHMCLTRLAEHLPKMLASGDQAKDLVELYMKANDDAATYSRELKETLCPELFGGDGTATAAAQLAKTVTGRASGTIHIKTLTGKLVPIEADPSDTIATVKMRIEISEFVPPEKQRLIFQGNELADDASLSACNINGGETIHLVQRLKVKQASADSGVGRKGESGGCCSIQ